MRPRRRPPSSLRRACDSFASWRAGWPCWGGVVVVFVDCQLPQSVPQLCLQVLDGLVGLIKPFGQPLDLLGQDARVLRPPLQNRIVRLPGPGSARAAATLAGVFGGFMGQGGLSPDQSFGLGRSMFNASGRPRTGRLTHTGSGRFIMGVNGYVPETSTKTVKFFTIW